jgi:hypothetical protein
MAQVLERLGQIPALEGRRHLRHLLEARMGNRGKREFIQVLRLMEAMPKDVVAAAGSGQVRIGCQVESGRAVLESGQRDQLDRIEADRPEPRGCRLCRAGAGGGRMSPARDETTPGVLLAHHLKQLKLHRREARRPDAALDHAPLTVDQLQFDQPQQVARVVQSPARDETTPGVLLAHHLKQLKLPTVLREYDKVARAAPWFWAGADRLPGRVGAGGARVGPARSA